MLCKHAMLAYPDFTKPFNLYTDASDLQLGATLVQEGKPIGLNTRKLNPAQQNYKVDEKELLGIVEGFKAFEGILRGTNVTVHVVQKVTASTNDTMETPTGRISSSI